MLLLVPVFLQGMEYPAYFYWKCTIKRGAAYAHTVNNTECITIKARAVNT